MNGNNAWKWIAALTVLILVCACLLLFWQPLQRIVNQMTGAPAPLTVVPPSQTPVVAATATLTLQPAVTETPAPTATPSAAWKLPDPPDANQLPTQLNPAISYIQPPVNCAKANDPNQTCSTIKGQKTDGDFVLKAGQALVMTGDGIAIEENAKLLADQPSFDTVHDLWVVVNTTGSDLHLHMLAPYGSFRGYFAVADGKWNIQKIAHLRDLHLYLFLLPTQTYDRFTPTPVPNCESKYGCDEVNVRVVVFDDAGMHIAGYGLYKENQPFWQDLMQMLGQ